MFTRRLQPPTRSFFLLGPRATGKTTWLRQHFGKARWFNLLQEKEWSRLLREPGPFCQEVEALPSGTWGGCSRREVVVRAFGQAAPASRAAVSTVRARASRSRA